MADKWTSCTKRAEQFLLPVTREVDVRRCTAGAGVRNVRARGKATIRTSIIENGILKVSGCILFCRSPIANIMQASNIMVRENPTIAGNWLVIDGMHRVETVTEMIAEGQHLSEEDAMVSHPVNVGQNIHD